MMESLGYVFTTTRPIIHTSRNIEVSFRRFSDAIVSWGHALRMSMR
jgi:hypothetical protein